MATSLSKDRQMDFKDLALVATDVDVSGALSAASQSVTTMSVTTLTPTSIAGGTFTTMFRIPTATVAAAGADQAGATAVTTGFTLVTGADDSKGVRLPTAAAGNVCIIRNSAAADLKIYPATSDAINAETANANITIVDNTSTMLVAYDATTWYTLPLVAS